ncbi:hypothetical protein HZB88_03175 [archaeon]|nr:hypothetical protein [archaeon]
MIKLGEKITLEGFESVDGFQLSLVKKLVGVFAKNIPEKNLAVRLAKESEQFTISIEIDGEKKAEEQGSNLFVVLGSALKKSE